jgi:hypothetical protein
MGIEKTTAQIQTTIAADGELGQLSATGLRFYDKVRKMRKHPTVSLARKLSVAPLLAANWSVEVKDGAPDGSREVVERSILPFRETLLESSLYGCLDYGWQPYEVVIGNTATGDVELQKVKPLLQQLTTILVEQHNGAFYGLRQRNPSEVTLTRAESLITSIGVEGTNWYGTGDMEAVELAYDWWNLANDGNVRHDKKVAGAHWVVYYPQGMTDVNGVAKDNFLVAKELLASLESSGTTAIPREAQGLTEGENSGWKIELLGADTKTTSSFIDRLKYCDSMICRAMGLPERAVIEGQFGTKAEAEAHADFAITNMELRHKSMVRNYNLNLVDPILIQKFGEQAKGAAYLVVAPIVDASLQMLRKVYESFLADPSGIAGELSAVDVDALRARVGVPARAIQEVAEDKADNVRDALLSFIGGM